MKLLGLLSIFFLSTSVFADHKNDQIQIQIVQKLSSDLLRLITAKASSLSNEELRQLTYQLRQAKKILKENNDYDDNRPHLPGPINPQRPGNYGQRVCSTENPAIYQQTFEKIKNFSYSGSGLNLTSYDSTNYALDWSTKYPCSVADIFISRFILIKNFAYSGAGLNYTDFQAKNYALDKLNLLCPGIDLVSEYQKNYNFAYSGAGLNYTSYQAREYAQPRLERVAFTCPSNLAPRH